MERAFFIIKKIKCAKIQKTRGKQILYGIKRALPRYLPIKHASNKTDTTIAGKHMLMPLR